MYCTVYKKIWRGVFLGRYGPFWLLTWSKWRNLIFFIETPVLHSGQKFMCFVVNFHRMFWFWYKTGIVSKKVYAVIRRLLEISSLNVCRTESEAKYCKYYEYQNVTKTLITSKSQTEKYQSEYKRILNEQKVYTSGHISSYSKFLSKHFDV